jgi:hypothetical protein
VARVPRPLATLVAILVVVGAWGGRFIAQTSFVVDGRRYFCLFDDPMISMAYARNFVEGFGLNWARYGAPVEGFTHPLWTFLMIPVNALPIGLEHRSLVVQLVSLGLLALAVVLVRRLMLDHFAVGESRSWVPAALLTAAYYPLRFWGLVGMETSLQAVLTVASVHLALNIVHRKTGEYLSLSVLLAMSLLLRMDMLLMAVAIVVYVAAMGGAPLAARRRWLPALGLLLSTQVGYLAFRWLYFGDVLPNTYYLKLWDIPVEIRVLRGLHYALEFGKPVFAVLAVGAAGAIVLLRPYPKLALPLALLPLYVAYSVYVGGDAYETSVSQRANRFFVFAVPMFFILVNALLNHALDARSRSRRSRLRDYFVAAAVTIVCLGLFNGLWWSGESSQNWRKWLGVDPPYDTGPFVGAIRDIHAVERLLAPDALVAVVWAGMPAYFTRFRMADVLGYNDTVVARGPMTWRLTRSEASYYYPGHHKWNYDHLLGRLRPDLVFQTWGVPDAELARLMSRYGYSRLGKFWRRDDSTRFR